MNDRNAAPVRTDLIAACVIAVIASAARLAMVLVAPPITPVADMADYWERALYFVHHGAFYPSSHRMPAYPAALALAFIVGSGPSLFTARLFNVFAGAATAVLTYWLARLTTGRRAACAAALAVALYPSLLIYTTLIATEVLIPVPLLGALIASMYSARWTATVAGVCTALAVLVRPAGIAVLPAVVVSFLRPRSGKLIWRPALASAILVVAAFAVTMSPWWLHNARLYGEFVALDTSGGMSLAVGNHELASGTYRWRETRYMMDRYLRGANVDTPAGSSRASAVAARYVREHPWAFVRLIPARLGALFSLEGREQGWLYSFDFFGHRTPTTVRLWAAAMIASFPLLLAAALAGWSVRGGISERVLWPTGLYLLSAIAMHAISIGDGRFHLPMVPVFAVLATGLAQARKGFNKVRLGLSIALLALLAMAWWAQLQIYWAALSRLAAPGGWVSQFAYDDLM
jgi:4-amino-4-deoxy-L-arabinose transferase-like glycosyltransferase